jgi:hypothetical protein
LHGYNQVLGVGVLQARRLAAQGMQVGVLLDIPLRDQDLEVRQRVEDGLAAQAAMEQSLAWSTLAFQHVQWRFLRYLQYRQRLAQLIKDSEIKRLTVSSGDDTDLVRAARVACMDSGATLQVLDGRADKPSSLLSFLASYDLPASVSLLESVTSRLLALYYRQKKVRLFYQPYNNIGDSYLDAAVLTWRRSISFPAGALPVPELGHERSGVVLETPVVEDTAVKLPSQAWPGFDDEDRKVLASAYSYFHRRYPAGLLSRLHRRLRAFLRSSRARRLVLNSDNTCTTRLLAGAAREAGVQVDYLPHGLIWEELSLRTGRGNGADRVLAWNEASATSYRRLGAEAVVISHPSNSCPVQRKRRFPQSLSSLRVLLMPPEWVGLSFAGRPDCFERDMLDALDALHLLGVHHVKVKCHHSMPEIVQAKLDMLELIRPYSPITFEVIDSGVRADELYEQFDLCIIGPTTGILEASRSATPFIAFRALLHKAGLFEGIDFPAAESVDELVQLVCHYDFEKVDRECERMAASLNAGCQPFAAELDTHEAVGAQSGKSA